MAASTPTSVTEYQTGFAPDIAPYAENLLGQAQDYTSQAYQPYQGSLVAGFQPLQQTSFNAAQNMQVAPQLGQATTALQNATNTAANANYSYNPYSAQGVAGAQGTAAQLGMAPTIDAAGFNQPNNVYAQGVRSQNFTGNNVAQYMNPYLQQSLAPQMQLLAQQQGMQQTANQAAQTQAGAFGGSRAGIQDALQNQSNQLAMSNLIGQGYNNAYNTAAQQFNTSNAANLQAQQANQGAGLQASLANQQMGYNTGLQNAQLLQQANLANQSLQGQYGLQQGQLNQQMGLQNIANIQQANLANQQAAQNAANLNAQQQQFGAGFGLQAAQTAMTGGMDLNAIGQNQYNQQTGIANLQNAYGTQQQQGVQNALNAAYQQYLAPQTYAQNQLGLMSNILHGLPTTTQAQQTYTAPPSAASILTGLAGTAIGASLKSAKGGVIRKASGGLAGLAVAKIA